MGTKTNQKSAAFHTLGCKVNKYETDAIASTFAESGFAIKSFRDVCDVYVINTCTVTSEADRKSGQFIRQAKKRNPDAIVVAMGCHIELSETCEYADIIIGNRNKLDAVNLVNSKLQLSEIHSETMNNKDFRIIRPNESININKANNIVDPLNPLDTEYIDNNDDMNKLQNAEYSDKTKTFKTPDSTYISHKLSSVESSLQIFEDMGSVTSREEARAYIKIEDGCNNFCSYCAIPLARGRVRSRSEKSILDEAAELAKKGFKEVVLTGIHVCSYASDRNEESDVLIDLAGKIAGINGIERIRLGSLEPNSITPKFITKMSHIPSICPHFHISLQSGCDAVLKNMNRHYTTSDYATVIANIRKSIPDATITTDVITGFPGESDADHMQTMEFCRKMNFLDIHVFKYSKRDGTKAAKMQNQVQPKVAGERSKQLIELALEMRKMHFKKAIGSNREILVESIRDNNAYGHTNDYMPAQVKIEDFSYIKVGEIYEFIVTGYNEESVVGSFVL
jgi:threonylcarbamoyladenosine tRNA methylthiotransferase MtaB